MKNLTLGQILTIAAYISTFASLVRIGMHHFRDGIKIWIPFDEKQPNRFWRNYRKVEATFAWFALALEKFKGKQGTVATEPATLGEALAALEESEKKDDSK